MRFGVILAALLGVALVAWLIVSVGVRSIVAAAFAVGWGGFVALCISGAALFVVLGTAWFVLAPRQIAFANFVWSRAVRECSGELLPFSQLGGILIGARALTLRGVDSSAAFASSVVDVTVEMVAQIIFILAGLAILLTVAPREPAHVALTRSVAIGVVAAIVAAGCLLLFQQKGIGVMARFSGRWFPKAGARFDKLGESLAQIHASPVRLAISLLFHLGGWVGTALWAWFAVTLIGRRISFPLIFTIEAILSAIRSAAIIVPGAIGVQEASYALIGPLLGLAAPAAIALSLLKRARDVALGIPVLIVWQFAENRKAWKGRDQSVR